MERAATQIYFWLMKKLKTKEVSIKIFCGMGNNGGDGLVLARLLATNDIFAQVYIVHVSDKFSHDAEVNYLRLKEIPEVSMFDIYAKDDFPKISDDEIIIDALFGSGLSRPLEGLAAELVNHLNDNQSVRIAIDIASGQQASGAGEQKNGKRTRPQRSRATLPFFIAARPRRRSFPCPPGNHIEPQILLHVRRKTCKRSRKTPCAAPVSERIAG